MTVTPEAASLLPPSCPPTRVYLVPHHSETHPSPSSWPPLMSGPGEQGDGGDEAEDAEPVPRERGPPEGVVLVSGVLGSRGATYAVVPTSVDRPLTKLHGWCAPSPPHPCPNARPCAQRPPPPRPRVPFRPGGEPRMLQTPCWGRAFWDAIGRPAHVCAPMVEASELAFRHLCRRYGTTLCYTPMIHSRLFLESEEYRAEQFGAHDGMAGDRPLFAQFCANHPETFLAVPSPPRPAPPRRPAPRARTDVRGARVSGGPAAPAARGRSRPQVPPRPSLLLPLPMSLLYTPSIDNSWRQSSSSAPPPLSPPSRSFSPSARPARRAPAAERARGAGGGGRGAG